MLLKFFPHPKQCARLFRGFTATSMSPHDGHRNTKRPSRIFDGGPSRPSAEIVTDKPSTSFLCAADRLGNVFAATPSDGTIGGPVVPGTGITASMWGSRGYSGRTHPGRVGPGRRPRMSANPAIAVRNGTLVMPFGSPGSEVLGQAMLQVFLNQAVFGMDPQSAVEAPRFASYSWPEST